MGMSLFLFMMSAWACVYFPCLKITHCGLLPQHCNSPTWKAIDWSRKMPTTLLSSWSHLVVCCRNIFRYHRVVLESRISPSLWCSFESVSYSSDYEIGKIVVLWFYCLWALRLHEDFSTRRSNFSAVAKMKLRCRWFVQFGSRAETSEPRFRWDNVNLTDNKTQLRVK